jgi:hypothetical protein
MLTGENAGMTPFNMGTVLPGQLIPGLPIPADFEVDAPDFNDYDIIVIVDAHSSSRVSTPEYKIMPPDATTITGFVSPFQIDTMIEVSNTLERKLLYTFNKSAEELHSGTYELFGAPCDHILGLITTAIKTQTSELLHPTPERIEKQRQFIESTPILSTKPRIYNEKTWRFGGHGDGIHFGWVIVIRKKRRRAKIVVHDAAGIPQYAYAKDAAGNDIYVKDAAGNDVYDTIASRHYEREIEDPVNIFSGGWVLSKTKLYTDLYTAGYRHFFLIDLGCNSNTHRGLHPEHEFLPEFSEAMTRYGAFGGKSKISKKSKRAKGKRIKRKKKSKRTLN